MRSATRSATLAREARLRDPAHRDQDGAAWRRGRFAERVRRQWNAVELPAGASPDSDLDTLAQAIQARMGGDAAAIRERLAEFVRLDAVAGPPAEDPLVRPGAAE